MSGVVVRDTTADGINLHIGWANVTISQARVGWGEVGWGEERCVSHSQATSHTPHPISQSSFRNTGDDAIALWSDRTADQKVRIVDNTVRLPH